MNANDYTAIPREKTVASERLLELLHQWLGCDEEAGNKFWFASGFYEERKEDGKGIGHLHNRKLKEAKAARIYVGDADIESCVDVALMEIRNRTKENEKTPEDFPTVATYRNYVARSLKSVRTCVDELHGIKSDHKDIYVESADDEDEKQSIPSHSAPSHSSDSPEEPTQEDLLPPLEILHAFHELLAESAPARADVLSAATEFFSDGQAKTTLDLKANAVAERIIEEYLDEKALYRHTKDLYDHIKDHGTSQPSLYTRRVREKWRQFRDGEGLDLWKSYSRYRFDVYTDFPPYDTSKSERPLFGRIDFGLQDFDQFVEKLKDEVRALQAEGGGVLVVPHSQPQEPSVGILLRLLAHELRAGASAEKVRLLELQTEPDGFEEALNAEVLVVSHLPRLSGLLSYAESSALAGSVIVGAGISEEWHCTPLPQNHRVLGGLPKAGNLAEWMPRLIAEEVRKYTGLDGLSQRIYRMTAVWYARGVSLRFDLLSRTLSVDEEAARSSIDDLVQDGLLYWIKPWAENDARVATKSPVVARAVVEALSKQDHVGNDVRSDCFHDVLKALAPERKAERYQMLQLFQGALPQSRAWQGATPGGLSHEGQHWARSLVTGSNWPLMQKIFEEVAPIEAVLWGRTLARLRLFDKADAALEAALRRHPRNAHLLHAHAQTLADQVQIDAALASRAARAFEKASAEAPGNCYIYQSWAVMRARAGRDPSHLFERALRAADGPGERAAVLVARADYEAERGNYEKATRYLDAAEEDAPVNAYVPHVRGKIAFLNGRYTDAETHLGEVIDRDLHSIAALNALGYMARLCGDWDVAQTHLQQAHDFDPENVPTLHERGNLLAAIADREKRRTGDDSSASEETRRDALDWYEKALVLEPDNVQVLVSKANVLLPLAAKEAGGDRDVMRKALRDALSLSPENARALHAFGRFHLEVARRADRPKYASEQRAEAKKYFKRILDDDRRNPAALCALADLHVDLGEENAARRTLGALERVVRRHKTLPIPAHERVRTLNAWAEVEDRLGKTKRAIELAEQARDAIDRINSYTTDLLQRLRRAR